MAGFSDNPVYEHVQYLLDWNPLKLEVFEVPAATSTRGMSSAQRFPPTTSMPRSTTTGRSPQKFNKSTRPASFYDKHLAQTLVLKHVKLLDSLVDDLAGTVDKTIKDMSEKGIELPSHVGVLRPWQLIKGQTAISTTRVSREIGVAENYKDLTASFCLPVASTLALHPSSTDWSSLLRWTMEVTNTQFAIADGALQLQHIPADDSHPLKILWNTVDADKRLLLAELPTRYRDVVIWEMKSLTVGDEIVMNEICHMGSSSQAFQWKFCKKGLCEHTEADLIRRMVPTLVNAPGFDSLSPPWSLPAAGDSSAVSRSLHHSDRIDGVRPPVYAELTQSSLGDHDNNPASEPGNTASPVLWPYGDTVLPPQGDSKRNKKKKVDDNASFEGVAGVRKEVNAQSFLQQSWAQAVRVNSTIIVLHSGNHEIIGIRHRKSQTLYVSHVIEPHSTTPAYGKIHVGLYIAALQEVMDRIQQDLDAEAKERRDAGPMDHRPTGGKGKAQDDDPDNEDHPKKRQKIDKKTTAPKKNPRKRGGGSGSRRAGGTAETDIIHTASSRHVLLVHLCYGIYLSPGPAIFVRKDADADILSRASEEIDRPESMDIILYSELKPGSTGIVHIGEMEVEPFGPTVKVAVKLAFSKEDRLALEREHQLYSHMNSKGVHGIPQSLGLFVGLDCDDGKAPYALVMTYAGVTLFGQKGEPSPAVKESLVSTLKSIHKAGVLHGDLRLPNFCVTPAGEAFIIDFSHAGKSRSKVAQASEMEELGRLLHAEGDAPQKKPVPEKGVEGETHLRRSSRIKILRAKMQARVA